MRTPQRSYFPKLGSGKPMEGKHERRSPHLYTDADPPRLFPFTSISFNLPDFNFMNSDVCACPQDFSCFLPWGLGCARARPFPTLGKVSKRSCAVQVFSWKSAGFLSVSILLAFCFYKGKQELAHGHRGSARFMEC